MMLLQPADRTGGDRHPSRPARARPLPILLAALTLAGCNLFTGAALLEIDSSGEGGSGGTAPGLAPADGVFISGVAIYQGVKVPLVEGGQLVQGFPVVASRDALLRIFYTTDASYNGLEVTAHLTIGEDLAPFEATGVITNPASTDENLESTRNIWVPGSALTESAGFRVGLLQPSELTSGQNGAGAFPPPGQDPAWLNVESVGATVKVMLVPVRYGADGSNRLPDTSELQLQLYRNLFYATYPVPNIEILVHGELPWSQSVEPSGMGWNDLLDAIFDLRQGDNAPADHYYYGIFAPADSFGSYCSFGCVAGLSMLADGNNPALRVGIGLGFSGQESAQTAIHEVGHEHGRKHSPCDVFDGIDTAYPYPDAQLGVWGYHLLDGVLYNPAGPHRDFMSYCEPTWVSDYTFRALLERIKLVNGAKIYVPEHLRNLTYERVLIGPDGTARYGQPVVLEVPPLGQIVSLTVTQPDQPPQVLDGHFFPYSHLPGGMLLFPSAAQGRAEQLRFELEGRKVELTVP